MSINIDFINSKTKDFIKFLNMNKPNYKDY